MLTVLEVIKKTTDFLAAKSSAQPRLDAELLVGHVLGLKRMQLYLQFERLLTDVELEKIRPLVRRRGLREPVQYILGDTDWFGLKLKVDRRALIPRPETERLMEIIVSRLGGTAPVQALDLGTGSGALALGLATAFPSTKITATDSSDEALALARENAAALGLTGRVEFIRSDWFAALSPSGQFDFIVANPPYLSADDWNQAQPEVREFEPKAALVADGDGTAALKAILLQAPRFLAPGGQLALETGSTQRAALLRVAAEIGYVRSESLPDLAGRDRYIWTAR